MVNLGLDYQQSTQLESFIGGSNKTTSIKPNDVLNHRFEGLNRCSWRWRLQPVHSWLSSKLKVDVDLSPGVFASATIGYVHRFLFHYFQVFSFLFLLACLLNHVYRCSERNSCSELGRNCLSSCAALGMITSVDSNQW